MTGASIATMTIRKPRVVEDARQSKPNGVQTRTGNCIRENGRELSIVEEQVSYPDDFEYSNVVLEEGRKVR